MGSGNFSSEYRGTRGTHQNQNSCNKEGGVGPSAAPDSSGKEEESKQRTDTKKIQEGYDVKSLAKNLYAFHVMFK